MRNRLTARVPRGQTADAGRAGRAGSAWGAGAVVEWLLSGGGYGLPVNAGKRERRTIWRWIGRISLKLDNPEHIWGLLGACWALHAGYIPYELAIITREEERPTFAGPPRGHPERVAGDQAPSQAEQELWTDLGLPSGHNPAAERQS